MVGFSPQATLKKGERILADILDKAESGEGHVSGADAFLLYDTFGYPLECTVESAAERGIGVDEEGFHAEMERQKKQSQVSWSRPWGVAEWPRSAVPLLQKKAKETAWQRSSFAGR